MRTPFFRTDNGMAKSTSNIRFQGERKKRYPASKQVKTKTMLERMLLHSLAT